MYSALTDARARCLDDDPDRLFVQGTHQHQAKLICNGCPLRTDCLAEALDNRIEFGVWGGMTERERRKLLRDHPEVSDWHSVLTQAQQEHGPGHFDAVATVGGLR